MRKHAVQKLQFLIRCAPNCCKTPVMCDKAVVENGGTLKVVLDS